MDSVAISQTFYNFEVRFYVRHCICKVLSRESDDSDWKRLLRVLFESAVWGMSKLSMSDKLDLVFVHTLMVRIMCALCFQDPC